MVCYVDLILVRVRIDPFIVNILRLGLEVESDITCGQVSGVELICIPYAKYYPEYRRYARECFGRQQIAP